MFSCSDWSSSRSLLFRRRTTTLGALLVMAAMSNVVMLNVSYDVPVKLFSFHLSVKLDTAALHMTLTLGQDSTQTMTFAYSTRDTSHLERIGSTGADLLRLTLERIGPHGMLLVDRGFHWVNESPHNR